MKRKYIFVDIDGCMTSIDDGNHYICKNLDTYGKCERTVNLLKKIAIDTGCRIVISSNWRKFDDDGTFVFDGMECPNPLPRLKEQLSEFIFGELPKDRHINKSEALELWFKENKLEYDDIAFAILDDDLTEGFYENPNFKPHFFVCNYHHGLTEDITKSIISYLNLNAAETKKK